VNDLHGSNIVVPFALRHLRLSARKVLARSNNKEVSIPQKIGQQKNERPRYLQPELPSQLQKIENFYVLSKVHAYKSIRCK
jgi:hypothetical protein